MADVRWTKDVVADLDEIGEFIERDSAAFARLVVASIYEAVERLRTFPRLSRVVPEFEREDLRELIYQAYRIVYRTRGNAIEIIAVWHGARDMTRGADERGWLIG